MPASRILSSPSPSLIELYQNLSRPEKICRHNPGLWNIVGSEKEWPRLSGLFDFLDPRSKIHRLKIFERDIYFSLFHPFLDQLRPRSRILDAGGGVGRFAVELAASGFPITLLDACKSSLQTAARHFSRSGTRDFKIIWADASDLNFIPDSSFSAALAIELICYLTDPGRGLQELIRVTRPGGLIFLSVEGKYGSLLADHTIPPRGVKQIVEENTLLLEGDRFTHYFTREQLKKLLQKNGLEILLLEGCHYLPEGPLQRFFDGRRLADPEYRNRILDLEEQCRKDPALRNLARSWAAVARKPVAGRR